MNMIRITTPSGREIPQDLREKKTILGNTGTKIKETCSNQTQIGIILSRECGNRFQCISERIVVTASTMVPSVHNITIIAVFPE